jgi:hypothetical protein
LTIQEFVLYAITDAFNGIVMDTGFLLNIREYKITPTSFIQHESLRTYFAEYVALIMQTKEFARKGRNRFYYDLCINKMKFLRMECFDKIQIIKNPRKGESILFLNEDVVMEKRNEFESKMIKSKKIKVQNYNYFFKNSK